MTPREHSTRHAANRKAYIKRKSRVEKATPEARVLFSARLRDSLLARTRRLVDEYLATGKYGYRTMTEAFEDLALRGLGTLRGDPIVDEMMPYMDLMRNIDRLHRARREAQGGLNRAKEEIAELQAIGDADAATQVYHFALDAAHAMPPTAWRDWMITELAKSFPELAKRPLKGVDLSVAQRLTKPAVEEERRKTPNKVIPIKERHAKSR